MTDDSLRFSETSASFLADLASKHATHSGGAARVRCAGEFVVLPRGDYERAVAAAAEEGEGGGGGGGAAGKGGGGGDKAQRKEHANAAADDNRDDDDGHDDDDDDGGSGEWVLVVDNNSGTYAPPGDRLPRLKALLEGELPGLRVATLDCVARPRLLGLLHALAPSRLPAPPGRAASWAASLRASLGSLRRGSSAAAAAGSSRG